MCSVYLPEQEKFKSNILFQDICTEEYFYSIITSAMQACSACKNVQFYHKIVYTSILSLANKVNMLSQQPPMEDNVAYGIVVDSNERRERTDDTASRTVDLPDTTGGDYTYEIISEK